MHVSNFCVECGERLTRKGWRALIGGRFCVSCSHGLGKYPWARSLATVVLIALSAFALGRYLRPAPPPLIIQRAANSPLSDLPVNLNPAARVPGDNSVARQSDGASNMGSIDDTVYVCGARTKKGTPCRRRVHLAGERCYQHKGMPAMVPLEKLTVKNK
jgi:hypothetical protein